MIKLIKKTNCSKKTIAFKITNSYKNKLWVRLQIISLYLFIKLGPQGRLLSNTLLA